MTFLDELKNQQQKRQSELEEEAELKKHWSSLSDQFRATITWLFEAIQSNPSTSSDNPVLQFGRISFPHAGLSFEFHTHSKVSFGRDMAFSDIFRHDEKHSGRKQVWFVVGPYMNYNTYDFRNRAIPIWITVSPWEAYGFKIPTEAHLGFLWGGPEDNGKILKALLTLMKGSVPATDF